MADATISLYRNIWETKNGEQIPLSIFLEHIQDGTWQDIVLPARALPVEQRREAKKKAPCVTLSGLYVDRKDAGSNTHSGFIGIDVDDVDPERVKEMLTGNPFVYSIFASYSGTGVCIVFRIDGIKHRLAFQSIQEYLYTDYQLIIDPTSINPSRTRFVSYDPHLVLNENAAVFKQYIKDKPPKKVEQYIFAQTDFEQLIREIQLRGLNIADSYHDWLRCGFAFAEKFGESGRAYFHAISTPSAKYNIKDADRQYDNCLKARGAKLATIATFYYYAKQAGLQLYSKETKQIIGAGVQAKKGGRTAEQAAANLNKFEQIPTEKAEPILEQVFQSAIESTPEESEIEQIEQWLRHNYTFRRNEITRYIECRGQIMKQKDFNTIYLAAKRVFSSLSYDLIERIINSDFTPTFNPLIAFFDQYKHLQPSGNIDKLMDSILSDDHEFTRYFGRKWLVGMIAGIHGKHNPLMLVLAGRVQGTGKTEWFRRLLPLELEDYFGESKLDAGKDDEILMTQKMLIVDDEMGGKSKNDNKRLKELLSKQKFSLREPYGKNNVDLLRIATVGGSSNEEGNILNDPTGNRRVLVVGVHGISHNDYNAINKRELLIEAYHLYKSGFEWELTRKDIERLNDATIRFESHSVEYELILQHYILPQAGASVSEFYTATQVKVNLENKSNQKLSLDKMGKELQRIGFKQISKKVDGMPKKVYGMISRI